MRLIITTVAAVCLGAHALLGCCWSHLGLGGCCEEVAASTHSNRCESGCCHHHPGKQHQDKPNPCKCDCRATCNFLPTVKVIDCEQTGFTGYFEFLPTPDASVELAYFFESHDLARSAPAAGLPLRLHLWNQSLLI